MGANSKDLFQLSEQQATHHIARLLGSTKAEAAVLLINGLGDVPAPPAIYGSKPRRWIAGELKAWVRHHAVRLRSQRPPSAIAESEESDAPQESFGA